MYIPHVLLITFSLHITTFLCDGVLILGCHQKVLDGIASFKMYLYPCYCNVLKALTKPFGVRHYHVYVVTFVVVRCIVAIGIFSIVIVAVFDSIQLRAQLR